MSLSMDISSFQPPVVIILSSLSNVHISNVHAFYFLNLLSTCNIFTQSLPFRASRYSRQRVPHQSSTMSSQIDQQAIWTPPVIATIVYRVVMIIVSIAFIWKKYRRPARQIDGEPHYFKSTCDQRLTVIRRRTTRRRPTPYLQQARPLYSIGESSHAAKAYQTYSPSNSYPDTPRGHLGPLRRRRTISFGDR